jgi:hypothetical protein
MGSTIGGHPLGVAHIRTPPRALVFQIRRKPLMAGRHYSAEFWKTGLIGNSFYRL